MRNALRHLRGTDAVMAGLIRSVGPYKIAYREPEYAALVRSILYQQVSGAAAATVTRRLLEAAGGKEFRPAKLLALGVDGMRACGVSRQKAGYLLDLSERTRNRSLRFDALPQMADEEVIASLTQVKGIGVWTAQMFLMFALRRPDVLPLGDLGIRNAIGKAYGFPAAPTPAEMAQVGEAWRPYRTVACWYLWRSLDGEAAI